MTEISIGLLRFLPLPGGAHVHVEVRAGTVGQAALCGRLVVTETEWQSLVEVAAARERLEQALARGEWP